MRKIVATMMGTALALSCGMAQSAINHYDIGTLDTTPFNGTFTVQGELNNIFFDTHTFDLVGSTPFRIQATITEIESPPYDIVDDEFVIFVLDSNDVPLQDGVNPRLDITLAPGNNYYFGVLGRTNGFIGAEGKYSLNIIAQPVPEAGTWAMMVAGLGLLGWRFSSRRRTANGHPEATPATA